ncbi:MAG: translation initiation factor IF-2 subunit beta [Candidatus Nanoarchaeia archaeon]|nr:translation initiation factor IF-2 subunit beta [Candidatus Nanoarchaeia archaeon]
METYEQLLNQAHEKIKPISHSGERFEIPKIEGHLEGTKTVLSNLPQIASYLRRPVDHFFKFLLKELATPGTFKNSLVVLQRKISSQKINEKIEEYAKEFVICKQCGKPDTEIIKDKGFTFMHCLACGAKNSIRAKV